MKAIARLVEPSSLISVHSLDVAPVSHSLNRLICQGFVGSRVDRKHLASEDVPTSITVVCVERREITVDGLGVAALGGGCLTCSLFYRRKERL